MIKILKIEGMSCGHCEGRVKNALSSISGVKILKVSAAEDVAEIEIESDDVLTAAVAAIEDAGYDVVK